MNRAWSRAVSVAGLVVACGSAFGQWNPPAGQWGKTDPADLRVMTWNVRDGICSSNPKVEGNTNWSALARVVAALKPDILILQEAGDNSGNGTGGGVDAVSTLETTVGLFLRGGTDPFRGDVEITAWVQKYDPNFDMPYVFASAASDNFNRNVIVSRYPFADLNGDTRSTLSDVFLTAADAWNPTSGRGGIRGYQFAEIDLPDEVYAEDVVIGNGHLKSGGATSDRDDRRKAAQVVAYNIYYWFSGAGGAQPDPNNKIADNPQAQSVLGSATPVIWGGDWNEDDGQLNNTNAPLFWMLQGGGGAGDGPDADGSNASYDLATEFFTGNNRTQGSSSKLDYIAYQDSKATLRRSFVFDAQRADQNNANPPEFAAFANPQLLNALASDHLPVVCDFILAGAEPAPGAFGLVAPTDGATVRRGVVNFSWSASSDAAEYGVALATDAGLVGVVASGVTAATSTGLDLSSLPGCTTYFWGVTAQNGAGSTASTPAAWSFLLAEVADLTTTGTTNGIPDGTINGSDFTFYLSLFAAGDSDADLTTTGSTNGIPDGSINGSDFTYFLSLFAAGCP